MSERLEIRTLGGLAIQRDGQPVTGLASRKVEALLAYLACAGRPRPRELVAEMLWEERTQERAMGNLRVALSSLRKRVGPYVTIAREEVGINPEADVWLDVQVLEQALSAARASDGPLSDPLIARMEDALTLDQGDFLAGFYVRGSSGFENWALPEREYGRSASTVCSSCWMVCPRVSAGDRRSPGESDG
jgi:DNA-binding SARP family transcriptional activator